MAEKGGLGQFTDLRGGLGEKEEMVFLRGGGGAGVDMPMHTMT